MAISAQRLSGSRSTYSAHRAVIFAIAQLSCYNLAMFFVLKLQILLLQHDAYLSFIWQLLGQFQTVKTENMSSKSGINVRGAQRKFFADPHFCDPRSTPQLRSRYAAHRSTLRYTFLADRSRYWYTVASVCRLSVT